MDSLVPAQKNEVDHRKAIMRMLPDYVSTAVYNIPEEYLFLDAQDLEELTPRKKFTTTDNKLRVAFWKEHARALACMSNMNMQHVLGGVCSRNHFYRLLSDKVRLAHMILPPASYDIAMEEFTNYGLDELRKSFDVAIVEFKSTKDPKMYESIRKTVEMLIVHTRGEPVRRVENKNLNLNMDANQAQGSVSVSMEDLDARLKELEAEEAEIVGEQVNA